MSQTFNHLDQGFGVEIECYLPEGATIPQVAAAVSVRLGTPDACRVEGYNHSLRTWWKVVTDGSLGDYARGIELVSPILRGAEGLAQVEKVCRALSDFGCTVSKKCGLHVHVGVGHPPLDFFKRMVKLYAMFEPVIDSMLPASRRASNNPLLRSITAARPSAIDAADSVQKLAAVVGSQASASRYVKLNITAYAKHRTVEFRHHSGTLDAGKATRWTVLCLRMVAAARRPDLALGTPAVQPVNRARPGSKAHIIGQLMLRPEGVSGREVCAATNWPSVSMPAQAQICGLAYTTQRMGREVRYFARAAAETVPAVAITVDGLASLVGCEADERQYMHQRVADLGGSVAWAA